MKILLYLSLLSIFLFSSCNEGVPIRPVENPEDYTTKEVQEMEKETIVVSLDNDIVYVFDENNQVRYKIVNMYKPGDRMILVPFYIFLLCVAIAVYFLLFAFNKNSKSRKKVANLSTKKNRIHRFRPFR